MKMTKKDRAEVAEFREQRRRFERLKRERQQLKRDREKALAAQQGPVEGGLLNPTQVAALLGLKTPETLCVWRSTKRYPQLVYVKIGHLVRYRRADVEAFIESRLMGS